jgi:hypothetical protein
MLDDLIHIPDLINFGDENRYFGTTYSVNPSALQ